MSTEFNFYELKTADRLPSPSGIALAIMQLMEKEDATLLEVAQLVKMDPALSGRILNFSNSSFFGAHRSIANIQDAVMMMGMRAVRNFALSLSLVGVPNKGRYCVNFDYIGYWSRSLAIAVAIASINAREPTVTPEESFTLGLLSEIGRLALAAVWSEEYSKCLADANEQHVLQMEKERFAIDHNELTLMLLNDWGLPSMFIDSLGRSFTNDLNEEDRVVRFARQLQFARLLGQYCLADEAYKSVLLPDLENEASNHGLEKISLLKFIEEVIASWVEWGKLIDIKTDVVLSMPVYYRQSVQPVSGLTILLVDDDPEMNHRLSNQLSEAGHQVAVCKDGVSALKYIYEKRPQMLITDWHIKPMDGLALCKTLRSTPVWEDLYIIMLTASDSEEALVDAFDVGIDDYVNKPVSIKVLLARIRAGQRLITLKDKVEQDSQKIEATARDLSAANRRLEVMANTDILTSLPNRRYAMARLAQEWESAHRYNRPISVLMLDLDYFKSVNDNLGHEAGDQVLMHVAKIVKQASRTTDIACRLGGEEFLVIAPNTDDVTAALVAERIRKAIEKTQPPGLKLIHPITASVGVAGSVGAKVTWGELMKRADSALYKVKQAGRNAVKVISS